MKPDKEDVDHRVGDTTIGNVRVCTSFMIINQRPAGDGPPILFETLLMIDNDSGGPIFDGAGERYYTREEAERGHIAWCNKVLLAEEERWRIARTDDGALLEVSETDVEERFWMEVYVVALRVSGDYTSSHPGAAAQKAVEDLRKWRSSRGEDVPDTMPDATGESPPAATGKDGFHARQK